MQIMKEVNGTQKYLLSDTGYGMAHYFDDACSVSLVECSYINTIKEILCPCNDEEEDFCEILSQEINFLRGMDRCVSIQEQKECLVRAVWENETTNRGLPRFTLEQLEEFVSDLQWKDFGWELPKYFPKNIFSNNPDSTTLLQEFLRGSSLKRVISALRFYKIKHSEPHLMPILKHIFERLDHKWNKCSKRLHISYPADQNTEYQRVLSLIHI